MNNWLLAILMFCSGVVTDVLWAFYIQSLAEHARTGRKRYLRAAAWWSVGTGVCTLVFVEGVVQNVWISTIWLLGLWLGTYYSATVKHFLGVQYAEKQNG